MKKLFLVLFTILLSTAFVVAQTSGSAGASGSQSPTSAQQPSSMPNSDQTSASQASSQTGASNTANNEKGNKTIEGCIVRESTEYYLQPKHGKMEKLSSTEDLSAHVGHQVKVHGTESKASENTASTSGTGTSATGGVSGQSSATGSQSSTSGTGTSGSVAASGNAPSASGGTTVDKSKISDKMITVEKIDMVSETCNIGNNKDKTKSDTTKY